MGDFFFPEWAVHLHRRGSEVVALHEWGVGEKQKTQEEPEKQFRTESSIVQKQPGDYILPAGTWRSPAFRIDLQVTKMGSPGDVAPLTVLEGRLYGTIALRVLSLSPNSAFPGLHPKISSYFPNQELASPYQRLFILFRHINLQHHTGVHWHLRNLQHSLQHGFL